MVNKWLKHFYLLIPWLSPLYEVTNTHVSVFLLRLKIQVTCPARLGRFLLHWTCWGLKHAPLWSQQLHTEGYGLVERALYWVTAACFQSAHPLTLLKTGTVTVSKRQRYEYAGSLWCMCVSVCVCMCVFVGACGVSGSAWQYMYSFYIHVHVIDTTHCIKKQKNKNKRKKCSSSSLSLLFFVPL